MKMEGEEVKEGEEMLLLKRIKRERERASGSTAKERISKMPPCAAGKRSSIYRGVTRHRWTGRYEAHLWDKDSWSETQNKKGKQVYLGAYDEEEAAARAYDLAALKYWGPGTNINFPVSDYSRDIEEMQKLSREDYLASLRRKSSGSTRGLSKYRLSKQHGVKWEASLGRTLGNKYFNAGSCSTSEEATGAYDRAQGEYGGYGIDLGSCIKWWQGNKLADPEPSSRRQTEEPTNSVSDDKPPENQTTKGEEPETSEWPGQAHCKATEPYQLPTLGVPLPRNDRQKSCSVTALSVLGKSSVFKHMLDKVSNSSEDIKKPQSAELDKGKGKLAMPVPEQLGNSSKDPGCVFGGYQPPHLNAMFPSIYQAESSQPLHHQANTSDNLSESLWTSFGQNTSGVALTNSVSIC